MHRQQYYSEVDESKEMICVRFRLINQYMDISDLSGGQHRNFYQSQL